MNSKAESDCIEAISGVTQWDVKNYVESVDGRKPHRNLIGFLRDISDSAAADGEGALRDSILEIVSQSTLGESFGGYGLKESGDLSEEDEVNVVFLCRAYMQAFGAQIRAKTAPLPLTKRPAGRPGMTLTEKIFAAHDVSRRGFVRPHQVIQVDVDWILASELSWVKWHYA